VLVERERDGNVEVLTLNRPEAANTLNPQLLDELGAALQEVLDDPDARAVVLTGAGERHFCAGMDLSALGDFNAEGREPGPGAQALNAFMYKGTYEKPVVAAVNGAAVGGGLELAMSCDVIVAAEGARFGLPEVKRGLYAAGGGTMLSTRIPLHLALEYGLTGELFLAPRAAEIGLVNHVLPAGAVMGKAMEIAEAIAANGPLGVALTKRLLRAAATDDPKKGQATPEEQSAIFRSADAREGAAAFMEKRPASFTGT